MSIEITFTLLTAIVIGLVQAFKGAFGIRKNFLPLLAIILGVLLSFVSQGSISSQLFIQGLVIGLMSCGLFSSVKATISK